MGVVVVVVVALIRSSSSSNCSGEEAGVLRSSGTCSGGLATTGGHDGTYYTMSRSRVCRKLQWSAARSVKSVKTGTLSVNP